MGKNRSYAAGWNMELPPRQSENPESCDYRWSIPVLVTVQYGDMCWVPHKAWAYRYEVGDSGWVEVCPTDGICDPRDYDDYHVIAWMKFPEPWSA